MSNNFKSSTEQRNFIQKYIKSQCFKNLPINISDEELKDLLKFDDINKKKIVEYIDNMHIQYTNTDDIGDSLITLSLTNDYNSILFGTILKDNFASILHCILKRNYLIFILKNISSNDKQPIPILFYPLNKLTSINTTVNERYINCGDDFTVYMCCEKEKFRNAINEMKQSKNAINNISYKFISHNMGENSGSNIFVTSRINISHNTTYTTQLELKDYSNVSNESIIELIEMDNNYIKYKNDPNHEEFMFKSDIKQLINNAKQKKYKYFIYNRHGTVINCQLVNESGEITTINEISYISRYVNRLVSDDIKVKIDITNLNSPSLFDNINILISPDQENIYWSYEKDNIIVRYFYIFENIKGDDMIEIEPVNDEEIENANLDF